jgi:hypothetical protein
VLYFDPSSSSIRLHTMTTQTAVEEVPNGKEKEDVPQVDVDEENDDSEDDGAPEAPGTGMTFCRKL